MSDDPLPGTCDASTVYWPEHESIIVYCVLPEDHDGEHQDDNGEWTD